MGRLFRKIRKALVGRRSSAPGPQLGSKDPLIDVLSVKPAYLNLEEFTIPKSALLTFSTARDEEILLDRCRRCSDGFVHTFMNWTTKIIAGIPKTDDYIAISYVWGDYIQLPMRCSHCGHSFHIPMESAYRFRRLMMMTEKPGDTVWLDALSIDQTSKEDKDRTISVMGDIYSRAKIVAVLFPEADGDGFKIVYDLAQAASAITENSLELSGGSQDGLPCLRLEELSKVCKEFYEMIGQFNQNLHKYLYWRRAWTFQEWALARDISITWEGGIPLNLLPVKSTILHAATLTSIHKFMHGTYAVIDLGFDSSFVPIRFETVKRLFPDEQAFHPPGTIDVEDVNMAMMMGAMRFDSALGLRAARGPDVTRNAQPIDQLYTLCPDLPESKDERFRHRLSMTLDTFGISKREARYEADLVSCWASMCNIKYAYDVQDSYVAALQKVLHSLRTEHKVKVHNFLVNTVGASGEVDMNFQDYACSHEQCNTIIVKKKFVGIPIFTGRADTGVHLRLAIARPTSMPQLKGSGVELRKIKDASILFVVPLKDHDEVLSQMTRVVYGRADKLTFANVLRNMSDILQSAPTAQLNRNSLAVVRIPLGSPGVNEIGKDMDMVIWAVIPSDVDTSVCFVAREGLNGTLILAAPGKRGLEVVAYLTLTDQQCGTLLISVNAHELSCNCGADHSIGHIEVTLKTQVTGRDAINLTFPLSRIIKGNVNFETGNYVAY